MFFAQNIKIFKYWLFKCLTATEVSSSQVPEYLNGADIVHKPA